MAGRCDLYIVPTAGRALMLQLPVAVFTCAFRVAVTSALGFCFCSVLFSVRRRVATGNELEEASAGNNVFRPSW